MWVLPLRCESCLSTHSSFISHSPIKLCFNLLTLCTGCTESRQKFYTQCRYETPSQMKRDKVYYSRLKYELDVVIASKNQGKNILWSQILSSKYEVYANWTLSVTCWIISNDSIIKLMNILSKVKTAVSISYHYRVFTINFILEAVCVGVTFLHLEASRMGQSKKPGFE